MKTPSDLRERYGQSFVVELPDGQQVPFKLLSLKDYLSYNQSIDASIVPQSILENEIFEKCVLDSVLIDNIYRQKAGTPTVVADTILRYSAPRSLEELSYFINYNRHLANNVLYQIVNIICLGFNGYTPDDILDKDIQEIMFLFAMAERKLLETGMIQEPFDFSGGAQEQKPKRPKVDVSKLKQIYEDTQEVNLHKLYEKGEKRPESMIENETPTFDDKDSEGNTIISAAELMYNERGAFEDKELQTLKDAQDIYKDYIEQIKQGKKVKIKTDEERYKEAEERAQENRKKFIEQMEKFRK